MKNTLTLRQMVNRIKKAVPTINPYWVKEYLANNTDGDFNQDNISAWITYFEKECELHETI
jgi:hypothetical protein